MSLQVTNTLTGEKYYLENISKDCAKKYTYLGKKDITDRMSIILHKPTEYHTYTESSNLWVCDFSNIGGMIEVVKKGRIDPATGKEMNSWSGNNPNVKKLKIIRPWNEELGDIPHVGYNSPQEAIGDLSHSGCGSYWSTYSLHSKLQRNWYDDFVNGTISEKYLPAKETCFAREDGYGNNICTRYSSSDMSGMTWLYYINKYLDMSICIASTQKSGFITPLWNTINSNTGELEMGHNKRKCIPSLSCDLSYTEDCGKQSTNDCSNYYQFDSCGIPYICQVQGNPKKCKRILADYARCYKSDNSNCGSRSYLPNGCASIIIGSSSKHPCNYYYEKDKRYFSAYTCVSGDITNNCKSGQKCTPTPAPSPPCREGEKPVRVSLGESCYKDASEVCGVVPNSKWKGNATWDDKTHYFICSYSGEILTKKNWLSTCSNELRAGEILCLNCSGSCPLK